MRSEFKSVIIAWISGGIVLLPVFILHAKELIEVILPIMTVLIPTGVVTTAIYVMMIKRRAK